MKNLKSVFYFGISASIIIFLTIMAIFKISFISENIGLPISLIYIILIYISALFIVLGASKIINK